MRDMLLRRIAQGAQYEVFPWGEGRDRHIKTGANFPLRQAVRTLRDQVHDGHLHAHCPLHLAAASDACLTNVASYIFYGLMCCMLYVAFVMLMSLHAAGFLFHVASWTLLHVASSFYERAQRQQADESRGYIEFGRVGRIGCRAVGFLTIQCAVLGKLHAAPVAALGCTEHPRAYPSAHAAWRVSIKKPLAACARGHKSELHRYGLALRET